VGTLAAGVAHEINNPLTYIMSGLEHAQHELGSLGKELPKGRLDEIGEVVREAYSGAERVRRIVRDLKTFSRPDEEEREAVPLAPVIESAIGMAQNEIRHRARLVRELGDTPPVTASEARLGQVFLNLLVNAAQAVPEGDVEHNEVRVRTGTDEKGRVFIDVSDTGKGIAPDDLGRIFDPFFTTKPVGQGTGLGLAICHGIVHALGGDIDVESQVGKGSRFRVTLPAARPSQVDLAAVASPPSPRRGRVLVVDDEPAVGRVVARTLSAEHDVVVATRARDALERITAGEAFDVVVCDLMMPEMTGMDLYAEVEKLAPARAATFVFLTGGAFTDRARDFLARVPNPRLDKPFTAGDLSKVVRERVAGR
jgi:CheY-like chemotaxis protein